MKQHSSRRLTLAVAGIALITGLIGGLVGVASGSHIFGDVPESHAFHDEIGALSDAGIATGFTGNACTSAGLSSPCYKPGASITRGQMAFQLTQGLGRISSDDQTTANPADGTNVIAESPMTGAAASGHSGYVRVDANASVGGVAAQCPCRLTLEIRDVNSNNIVNTQTQVMGTDDDCIVGTVCGSISTFHVFVIPGHVSNSYQARARLSTVGTNTGFSVSSHVVVEYIPFNNNPTG